MKFRAVFAIFLVSLIGSFSQASPPTTQSFLLCGGGKAGLILKGAVAACRDIGRGQKRYLDFRGLGGTGLAVQGFVVGINHDADQPLRPQFTALGGSHNSWHLTRWVRKAFGSLASFLPVMPEYALFHSVSGNQGGFVGGLSVGKIWNSFDPSLGVFRLHYNFQDAKESWRKLVNWEPEDLNEIWESRLAQLRAEERALKSK